MLESTTERYDGSTLRYKICDVASDGNNRYVLICSNLISRHTKIIDAMKTEYIFVPHMYCRVLPVTFRVNI